MVGSGPGGLAAALAAARAGVKVTLLERFGCFGGNITAVGVEGFAWYRHEQTIDSEGLGIEFEKVGGFDPVTFNEGCVSAVRAAAARLGYSHMDLISGAGHDACWINRVAPTAMVMCPCVDGLSHNEAEEISKEWAQAGAEVLMHAVVETAEVVG